MGIVYLLGIRIFTFHFSLNCLGNRFESTKPCSHKTNVPADLQSAGIEYKDFNPLASYFKLLGMNFGSQILIINAVG